MSAPATKPLAGIRVADLTMMWAGPYAAKLLADYGADVIKIEAPRAWDNIRTLFPTEDLSDQWFNSGAYFHEYSRNKRGLSLDLSQARGKELFGRLVAECDVVIQNYRADVMDKLGLTEAWLREQRPDLVIVGMAGFGKSGPEARALGYGPIIEQMSGLASLSGYGDGMPRKTGISYGDPIAGIAAASAAVTGLIRRHRTGQGMTIDLAQREVVTSLIGEFFALWSMNQRQQPHLGSRHEWMAPHNAYPCLGDDQWVAIAVGSDAEWRGLVAAMGRPDWASDEAYADQASRWEHRDALDERVGAWTRERSKQEVFAACRAAGVPCGPVWNLTELLADEQLNARGFYEPISDPDHASWMVHGWVWRWTDSGPCILAPAPNFGQHTREILTGLLGVDPAELPALAEAGVIADAPIDPPVVSVL